MADKWQSAIEQQIQAAISRGDLSGLKGEGKPIDLDGYFSLPEESRAAYGILKQYDAVPEEVLLLQEIGEIKKQIKACADPKAETQLKGKLQNLELKFALRNESNR